MKKTLLLFSVISLGYSASAQCTPDASVTSGISPDTVQNLSVAYTGQAYSQVVTFFVPADTTVSPIGTVPIHGVELDDVTGLPSNFTYGCNPSNCYFVGGSLGCVDLYSTTDPITSQIGTYPITILATGFATIFGSPVSQGQTVYDGYYLVIADGATQGMVEVGKGEMKSMIAYPNPTSGVTTIEFAMGYSSEVKFTVTNLLGSVITSQTMASVKGLNTIKFDATQVPNGVYLYTITDGKNTISKKLIVNK